MHHVSLITLVGIMLLVASPTSHASKLYQYKDDNGRIHFSDTPPPGNREAKVSQLDFDEAKPLLHVVKSGTRNNPEYVVTNSAYGPIQLSYELSSQSNTRATPSSSSTLVVPGGKTVKMLALSPVDPQRSWSYQLKYSYVPGSPDVTHDQDALYLPPFAPGKAFAVSQAFNGSFSHNKPHSQYAVDFSMPEGTPIHASRGGVVMSVEQNFYKGGTDIARFGPDANMIRILHSDGTMGVYAHLQVDSVAVTPGKSVKAAQFIARSGNTGFSTGPHLHFVVQKNTGMDVGSVPIQFMTADGSRKTPALGMMMRAPDSGLQAESAYR